VRIRLDERSPRPLSDQLATALAERIQRGSLAPGSRLPTVRALAEDLGLAANTVAKAYRTLEDSGLIEGRGRQGTFVTDRLPKRSPIGNGGSRTPPTRSSGGARSSGSETRTCNAL
jgi:DNA-binding transcriptional regulator YhcF (GntR family)